MMLGIEELSEADRLVVRRARKLQRYLTQPFHVVAEHTGIQGVTVPLTETLRNCEALLRGEYDQMPEESFYMQGVLADVTR